MDLFANVVTQQAAAAMGPEAKARPDLVVSGRMRRGRLCVGGEIKYRY